MAATTLCSHSGELEIVQLYHGHGRKELFNTLTILQSFSVLSFFFFLKESLPLFIDFKEGRTQTSSESQNEFGFLRLLEFWKNEWIYLIQWIYLISFIPFFQHLSQSMNPYPLDTLLLVHYVVTQEPESVHSSEVEELRVETKFQLCCGVTHVRRVNGGGTVPGR